MALTQIQVSQIYVSTFGRASEGEGSEYWIANSGDSFSDAVNTALGSPAGIEYFGTALDTDQAFVEYIYLNTLGKTYAEDTAGIDYWVGRLADDSRGVVVEGIVDSLVNGDFTGDDAAIASQNQFNNRVTVSNYTAETKIGRAHV